MIRYVLCGLALIWATPILALQCENLQYDGNRYTVCEVQADRDDIRLFLRDETGDVFGHFTAIDEHLDVTGLELVFGMNAGMYHADRSPVGHYVENGQEVMRVIPNAGPGNFGLLPNGVFCIRAHRADVIETLTYIDTRPDCEFATQSGPMLVIDGALHSRFLIDSTSRFIRNGVGTSPDGSRVVFAISRNTVTFHEFGSLFRDHLKIPSALYFDGNVSRLYAPGLGRNDSGRAMGPVVGVVQAQD